MLVEHLGGLKFYLLKVDCEWLLYAQGRENYLEIFY